MPPPCPTLPFRQTFPILSTNCSSGPRHLGTTYVQCARKEFSTYEQTGSEMAWLLRILGAVTIMGTVLPLIRSGQWFIRVWDFPRLQLLFLLVGVMIGIAFYHRSFSRTELIGWLAVCLVATLWQASHIVKFTPLFRVEVPAASDAASTYRLLVSNLHYETDTAQFGETVISELRDVSPDVLILVELDQDWRQALDDLANVYPYRHEEIRGEGLGLGVWSRLPLESPRTRFLVEERRPSIWAKLMFEGEPVNLVAVHPTPPGVDDSTGPERRDSRVRDAELVLIAKEVAARRNEPWIIAGDFNDVAWSHTTRLFKRLSGLNDPRVGRNFLGTFHSRYPLLRFPIDHVFVSDGFAMRNLQRHYITGSDHFAVSVDLSLVMRNAGTTPEPQGDDPAEATELLHQGIEDAQQRGVSAAP
ncbi:MAG: hypothetical protein KatS3mg111_2688 [Pirellulaceae bacterium]|nr:MAG: hypothetical protein KatS3mg111_2688 [Pirellulaceae bacterium]